MNLKNVVKQAQAGRPDLAALNLGLSRADGMLAHPVKLLRIIAHYPHSGGKKFGLSELARIYRAGRDERIEAEPHRPASNQ